MKKVLALLIATLMIVASFAAFAADGDLTADTTVSITNLTVGDTVNLYKVLERDNTNGAWKLAAGFTALGDSTNTDYFSQPIKDLLDNKAYTLTQDDVAKIVALAASATAVDANNTVTGTTYTFGSAETPVDVGMYLALVTPVNSDVVYNPVIISADYKVGDNSIDISSDRLLSAVAKKETVTLTKEVDKLSTDVDDAKPVKFTIETTIPVYAKSYTNPSFVLTDTMQPGIAMMYDATKYPFTVTAGSVTYSYESDTATGPATDQTTFTLTFDSAKIAALTTAQTVKVEYYAYITDYTLYNVNEETNDVEVTYSHNPKNSSDHGHLKDEVKVYTFSIDGSLFGRSNYQTGEVVKIGKDAQGNIIESYKELSNGSKHGALEGAVFGVYATQADADAANENYYKNDVFPGTVTTDEKGLMKIEGLAAADEGTTYYLRELSAPKGYIKDPNTHTIVIKPKYKTVEKTETFSDCGHTVKYDVKVLDSYKVTVDGTESSYSMTLNGPSISSVTPGDSSSEIVNTKGVELPSTGGVGTTIFYVAGSILVLAAVIFLVTKRRMSAND